MRPCSAVAELLTVVVVVVARTVPFCHARNMNTASMAYTMVAAKAKNCKTSNIERYDLEDSCVMIAGMHKLASI